MNKINWQNGTLVSPAKVEIGGVIYEVTPEQYSGNTPLSAENLNQMQDNIEEAIPEVIDNLTSTNTSKALSANQGKELKSYIDNIKTYSTDEKQVGTWINSKPTYRMVLNLGTITEGKTVNTGISNMSKLTKLFGTARLENAYDITLPTNGDSASGTYFRLRLQNNGAQLVIECSANTFYNTYVIIEYTKTTD